MKIYTLDDIKQYLGAYHTIIGNERDVRFDKVMPLNQSDEYSLCWLSPLAKDKSELIRSSKAKTIICRLDEQTDEISTKVFIKVGNPRLIFARVVKGCFTPPIKYGIHPSASIHAEAVIGDNVYIGPGCVIGKCHIGSHSVLHGNCFVFDHVTIGQHVTIQPNATIGGVGFGYEKNDENEFELFPHTGTVTIEDHVDIGANTCIDRGTLGATRIGEGTKIDNLVHIAHNVNIGRNCAIIAHSMIGGSTVIEDNAWIAPTACLRDGLRIGKNSTVGLGAVVVKSVPDNEIWIGNPAKKYEK